MALANVEVPPIEMRPFEKEIIDAFKTFSPALKRGGRATPHKGVWIRGHLLASKEDYAYAMWKRWVQFTRLSDVLTAKIDAGTYMEFLTYMWLLKKLSLILFTRERGHSRSPAIQFQRRFYTVNPAELGNPLWENPFRDYESHMRWARRKFRRPGEKRKKRGKPPRRSEATASSPV